MFDPSLIDALRTTFGNPFPIQPLRPGDGRALFLERFRDLQGRTMSVRVE